MVQDLTSRLNRHMQIKATSQEQEEVKVGGFVT
jgi:hypothetical protein